MRYLPVLSALTILAVPAAHAQTMAPAAMAPSTAPAAAPAVKTRPHVIVALKGLLPFATLPNSAAGKAALDANYEVTGAIQTGTASQPGLQPFPAQQAQALHDAFITLDNASNVADGLGTTLGNAYQAKATYSADKTTAPGKVAASVNALLTYSVTLTGKDASAGKFFFADAGFQKGQDKPQAQQPGELALLATDGGTTNVFGKAYCQPACAHGTDPYGDSRPFQTEKTVATFTGVDYFGRASSNTQWLEAPTGTSPAQGANLDASPSFPSGHTTYGYTSAVLLAILVPERYTQEITRGAEYGNSRIVLGAHYAMDVIGGRTLALYDLAQLLNNNTDYVGQAVDKKNPPITNYPDAIEAARKDLAAYLETATGTSVAAAAAKDSSRFANPAANEAFYESTLTYGLPTVFPAEAGKTEDVAKEAPEAGTLLTAAFPYLTLKQADDILTATEAPGGGFLDNGKSKFGLYSRLDLYKASLQAEALAPKSGD
jgi:hypothetical protein